MNETSQISVVNGVEITTDENGNQHFRLVEEKREPEKTDERGWFEKLKDWFRTSPVVPCVKLKNLSDPSGARRETGFDDGSGAKTGIEIGLKIRF